jgi:hypothetical protein
MTAAPELIRPTTRRQLLETAKRLKKAVIEACWQDGGFVPVALDKPPSTERAAMFTSYSAGVDWTDEQHVARALGVFEALLESAAQLPGVTTSRRCGLRSTSQRQARGAAEGLEARRVTSRRIARQSPAPREEGG